MKDYSKKDEELISEANLIIGELVKERKDIIEAYNYYNGVLNKDLYKYLEDTYGIGTPTSVEFIPLLKKHIDALIGEYLNVPKLPKVYCKDKGTITKMFNEKIETLQNNSTDFLMDKLAKDVKSVSESQQLGLQLGLEDELTKELNDLQEDLKRSFTSAYEETAQHVIDYLMQSLSVDMETCLWKLYSDLLITGYCYFRTVPSKLTQELKIEVLNPGNTFTNINPNSHYFKDSTKSVVRKYMTHLEVVSTYADDLSKEDIDTIQSSWFTLSGSTVREDFGWYEEYDTSESFDLSNHLELVTVLEVQWITVDDMGIQHRNEVVKINDSIFIVRPEDYNLHRSISCPRVARLDVNGLYFINRGKLVYSLVRACKVLQDKYNILHFYRDNLIANSGTAGDFVDMAVLPTFLGNSPEERLLKYVMYKKLGFAPIDSSQEGKIAEGMASMNTIYNGYDDTVKLQPILAIQMVLEYIELTISSITGVFRERLNGIQQRDAVLNVQQSLNNSFTATRIYYQLMDLVTLLVLSDSLNVAKIVFKNGLTGNIILGEQNKIFTALPENFTMSDYDIRMDLSSDVVRQMLEVKLMLPLFVQSQQLEPTLIFEALQCKSLAEINYKMQKAFRILKLENNIIGQLQQLGQQLLQQLELASLELEKALKLILKMEKDNLLLEQLKMQKQFELDWYLALTDRTYKLGKNDIEQKRTEMELAQIRDGNPYNDQIKQI